MRFTQLRLRNWRNFTRVDVALARRMFIVGPNAIGKSNLLDVFRFLRELTIEGGGLGPAVKNRRGLSRLRSLHQKGSKSDVEIDVKVLGDDGREWRYVLAFNRGGRRNDDTPLVKKEQVWVSEGAGKAARSLLDRPNEDDRPDPKRLSQTAIQQVTQNREFREVADFFASVGYLHLVPQLIREEQLPADSALGGDQYGRDLLSRIRGTTARTQKSRLQRIRDVLKIAVPYLEDLELVLDEDSHPHLQAAFRHWRGPAAKQDEREFSDGTLRLIGLLWALQERAGPLLLEEPEMSLHTALVRQLAPFISRAQRVANGRQALISTQSEELMSDPGIGPAEILLIRPIHEGSEVVVGAQIEEIRDALGAGLTAAEVVMPMTAMAQIDMFATAEP